MGISPEVRAVLQRQKQSGQSVYPPGLAAKAAIVQTVRTFPIVVRKVMALLQNPDFKTSELAQLVEQDPSLVSNLMRIANSAFFSRGQQLESIDRALVRLGRTTVNELVCAVAAMDVFPKSETAGRSIRDHCAATAAILRHTTKTFEPSLIEGAFLCGLMHDIGKLMLISIDINPYVRDEMTDKYVPTFTHENEWRKFGFDHGLLGGQVLWAWKVPEPIPTIVAWHHVPEMAYMTDSPHRKLLALLRVADQLEPLLEYPIEQAEQAIKKLCGEIDATIASINETYLVSEWTQLQLVRANSLKLFT